jgi:hypothetical protein
MPMGVFFIFTSLIAQNYAQVCVHLLLKRYISPCDYTVLTLKVFSIVRGLRLFAFLLDVISYENWLLLWGIIVRWMYP